MEGRGQDKQQFLEPPRGFSTLCRQIRFYGKLGSKWQCNAGCNDVYFHKYLQGCALLALSHHCHHLIRSVCIFLCIWVQPNRILRIRMGIRIRNTQCIAYSAALRRGGPSGKERMRPFNASKSQMPTVLQGVMGAFGWHALRRQYVR